MATTAQKRQGMLSGSALGSGLWIYGGIDYLAWTTPLYWGAGVMLVVGGWTGYRISRWLGTPNDTVNYTLRLRGRRVYEGVAYSHRLAARIREHKRSAKKFDRVDMGKPRPREEALRIEEKRIKRYQPRYNVVHKD